MSQEVEIWRTIEGWSDYQISSHGRLKSLARVIFTTDGKIRHTKERIIKPGLSKGYRVAVLCINYEKRSISIHRLVAEAFVPRIEGKEEVDHIDRDKSNNTPANLRWVNDREQADNRLIVNFALGEKHGISKLTEQQVREIFASKIPTRKLGPLYGVSRSAIQQIKRGNTWTHVTKR